MNDQQKQQVIEQIKSAKHVLVTVSTNPTVDELAASIGLTLAINKMDKHATTVFSGHVPSTIEFLQPENTIETTTDSLRDFIIALDKSKADKLRYKVEDDVVRIFITPYRTTITDKDLDFSQGDFNVDLVIGLGVTNRQDLDTAITAHGRILHDATIVSLTKRDAVSDLGSVNWQDTEASSLCEMTASIITAIQPEVVDGQMATAFLTGIIAETDRFKNEKTTPIALSLSSQLMSAGANQQLIAEKLDEPEAAPQVHTDEFSVGESQPAQQRPDGELEIDHSEDQIDKIHIDDHGNLNLAENVDEAVDNQNFDQAEPQNNNEQYQNQESNLSVSDSVVENYNDEEILPPLPPQPEIPEILHRPSKMLDDSENRDTGKDLFDDLATQESDDSEEKPTLDQPESSDTPMLEHQRVVMPPAHPDDLPKSDKPFDPQEAMQAMGVMQQTLPSEQSVVETLPPAPEIEVPEAQPSGDSLADLEKSVGSSHVASEPVVEEEQSQLPPPDLDAVRDTVIQAANSVPPMFPEPSQSIGAHPISLEPPKVDTGEQLIKPTDPNAPPPVPPPMTPQFYDADGNNSNPFVNPHP
jgi:hypothetical protein